MFQETYLALSAAGTSKISWMHRRPSRYFLSSMMAGLFISFGSFVAFTLGASVAGSEYTAPWSRLLQSAAFAAALSLVIMAGAELFTGNHLTVGASLLRRTAGWKDSLVLWGFCWLGNLVGSVIGVALFLASNVPTGAVGDYFCTLAVNKVSLSPSALIARAILCNILVCLAVWCSFKMKSESGKLIMIFWCIFVFMVCGFEHSIANMSVVGVGLAEGAVTLPQYAYSILLSSLGNWIGGFCFVALPYHLIAQDG